MGSLVECHLATSFAYNGGSACAGVAWAACRTPEVKNVQLLQRLQLNWITKKQKHFSRETQRRLASRDLEVVSFDMG